MFIKNSRVFIVMKACVYYMANVGGVHCNVLAPCLWVLPSTTFSISQVSLIPKILITRGGFK
jgi:hypothetical protein